MCEDSEQSKIYDEENDAMKYNTDFINTSSEHFNSSDESEKCENESNETFDLNVDLKPTTVKEIPGPKDLSQTLEDGPKQPNLVCYPKKKIGNRMRHFFSTWYELYNWIEYSIINDSVFCFPCRFFCKNYDKTIFVSERYSNWKNALDKSSGLKKHNISNEHKTSNIMWISYLDMKKNGNVSVTSLINEGHLKLVKDNRDYIKMVGKVLLFTAIQGIAQRGDNEGDELW